MLRLSIVAVACCAAVLSANAQTVSKAFKDQPLKSVLKEIELQTGLSVIYDSDKLVDRPVTAEFNKTPVEQALRQILDANTDFSIVNRMIVIHDKRSPRTEGADGRITGIVTDEAGDPLTGASVVVRGNPSKGTVAGGDGKFTLNGISPSDELEVTFLGYNPQIVSVGNRRDFSIVMSADAQQIEELVIVGYGVQKKSDITGSVTSVKAAELTSAPSFSTSNALQGRVAGVMVQNTSGSPTGGDTQIRIRGANSLTYGNSPLVIIDGVQGGDMNSLNPNQIESIEVLKDAAALSVYGSRGANGVILVTTKGGKGEKAQISYNGFVSVDRVANMLPALEAWEYATLFDEYRRESGNTEIFGPEAIATLGKGTNWQEKIFRNAVSYNHNLSIGGSKRDVSYYFAAGISQKEGVILNTDFDQYTLRGNIKAQATKRLDLMMNLFAVYDENNQGAPGGALPSALQWSPTQPVYDPDSAGGYSQPATNGVGPVLMYNPVGIAKEAVDQVFSGGFHVSLKADYRLWDWLKISSQLVYRYGGATRGYFENQVVNNGLPQDVSGSKTVTNNNGIQNTNILTFDKTWNGHNVQATAVYELSKSSSNSMGGSARGIPVKMGYHGISYGTKFEQPWPGYSASAMQSVMGRINYAFKNRYMLSGSVRYDGASQLADGHKFDTFWAVSGGWNVMEEAFAQGIKRTLSDLKIRASYGTVGNSAVPAYSSLMLFSSGLDANNNPTLAIAQAANPNLRWERTSEFNIGVDASLWGGRLDLTVEYYDKKTSDLLMWQKQPIVTGTDKVLNNVGSVSNKGWDFALGGTPFSNRDFAWTVSYTMNLNRNEVLTLDGINNELIGGQLDYPGLVGSHVQRVGQPMATYLGYTFAGTWKTEEASTAAMYGYAPGDAKFVDINRDGRIDKDDISIIGNAQPKGIYGINNSFRWKNLDLNIFFQGVWGNEIYNVNRVRRESYGDSFPTNPVIRDHWTPEHQTELPSFTSKELVNSSRWVEDGSYLRLKNLSIGYRFPERWMSKIRVSSLRVYASGSNLWTLTGYSGYDPEAANGMDANGGVDYGVYPSVRSFVFGIDLSF